MGIIPMDKINIFPYFGGNMNDKTLTEENISSSFKVLGLNSSGYPEYEKQSDQIVLIEPFKLSYKGEPGSFIEAAYATYTFQITKGSGHMNGYKFDISDTIGEIKVEGYFWKPGGTLYLQMAKPSTVNGMLEPLYSLGTGSNVQLNYTNEFTSLTKDVRQWSLPIARLKEFGGVLNIEYTCPLSALPNLNMENGSQYLIDVSVDGIKMGLPEDDDAPKFILDDEGVKIENAPEFNVECKKMTINVTDEANDGVAINSKGQVRINTDDDTGDTVHINTGYNHRTVISGLSIYHAEGGDSPSTTLSYFRGLNGDINIVAKGESYSLGDTLKKVNDMKFSMKEGTFHKGPVTTLGTMEINKSLGTNGRGYEYTINSDSKRCMVHAVYEKQKKFEFKGKCKDDKGGFITWEAVDPIEFKFYNSTTSDTNNILFDNVQTYVSTSYGNYDETYFTKELGSYCTLSNCRYIIKETAATSVTAHYNSICVYPTIIGTPDPVKFGVTNEIELIVHLSVDMIQTNEDVSNIIQTQE